MSKVNDDYMLETDVWLQLHPEGLRGFLCFSCLKKRSLQNLGRFLLVSDFTHCFCAVNLSIHNTLEQEVITEIERRNKRVGKSVKPLVTATVMNNLRLAQQLSITLNS
jgi:hypothetical protein